MLRPYKLMTRDQGIAQYKEVVNGQPNISKKELPPKTSSHAILRYPGLGVNTDIYNKDNRQKDESVAQMINSVICKNVKYQ